MSTFLIDWKQILTRKTNPRNYSRKSLRLGQNINIHWYQKIFEKRKNENEQEIKYKIQE